MNTNELVSATAVRQNMSKAETRRILDAFVSVMSDSLVNGRSFTLPGIGTFLVHKQGEHPAYNPHEKQEMMLPPKRVIHFNPAKTLEKDVRQIPV
jgi:DNA-binding protein HU-beta